MRGIFQNLLKIAFCVAIALSLISAKKGDDAASDNAAAKNINEAKSAAAADARNQLAQMMKVLVTNISEKSKNTKRRAKDIGDEMTNQYVFQSLESTKPIHWSTYDLSDGTVEVHVCMEMVRKRDDFSAELGPRIAKEATPAPAAAPAAGTAVAAPSSPSPKPLTSSAANPEAERLFESGRDNCRRFKHNVGIPQLLDAVDKGSVNAQNFVGLMYLYGDNVERDSKLAFRYLLSAA
ncbi:MAG: SEL1-like repeat protein [Rikenellaceae bacterium]